MEFRHATALLLTRKDEIILQIPIKTVCNKVLFNLLAFNF